MRVGTRYLCFLLTYLRWDHPHACGDKLRPCLMVAGVRGSSPCVWGQAVPVFVSVWLSGIIPMRVGTRYLCFLLTYLRWDHPHACGDKSRPFLTWQPFAGSSPCVWGQVDSHACDLCCQRIIPMRVGTRRRKTRTSAKSGDHPHACGDKLAGEKSKLFFEGSSPCVWGQGCGMVALERAGRIIPMRVGTSKQSPITSNGG